MAATLRDTVVVAIMNTCPLTITLAIITRRKPIHGFAFLYGYGAPLGGYLYRWSSALIQSPSFSEYYWSHCDIYMKLQPFKRHQVFWEVRSEGVVLKSVGNLSRKVKYFLFSVK